MKIVHQFNREFVIELETSEFLDCFLFLTTVPMSSIVIAENEHRLSGFNNPIASVTLDHPHDPVAEIIEKRYWINYAWIWNVLAIEEGHHHFRMSTKNEYTLPPIPKSLWDFWNIQLK